MNINDVFPSKYLKASDLTNSDGSTKSVIVIMSHYEIEKVGDDTKPVLYFQGATKGLVLNVTNANVISQINGEEMDLWRGKQIELWVKPDVEFQGKTGPAIRVRAPTPQVTAQPALATATSVSGVSDGVLGYASVDTAVQQFAPNHPAPIQAPAAPGVPVDTSGTISDPLDSDSIPF